MKQSDAITALSALAQDSRLSVYRLLVKRGPDGFTPSDIAEKLDVPAPTLSFHLKELQRAGLLKVRREGRRLFYSPDFGYMSELMGFLNDNCCSLAGDGCGPACATPAEAAATQLKRRRA
jgi:DNA-binding transcriptional ArsR family regulator